MALFAKITYADGVDTASLLALRFVIASVLLGGLAFARGVRFPQGYVLVNYMLMGVAYASMAWAYFSALHYASSASVAMVLYVYPILVAVAAAALRIDRFGLPESLSLAFSTAGLYLVLGGTMQDSSVGLLLALVAALCYSGYILIGSRSIVAIDAVDAIACSTVVLATATVCCLVLTLTKGPQWPKSAGAWAAVVGVAVFGTAIAIAAFVAGLRRIGPTQAAVLSTLEPVVTVALGIGFLGEESTMSAIAGGGLILLAAIGLTLARNRRAAALMIKYISADTSL